MQIAALARMSRPRPAILLFPVPNGPPIRQFLPLPPVLAQSGGLLDQSAWLSSALDLIEAEHAAVDRMERGI